jgi:hypothetical protein
VLSAAPLTLVHIVAPVPSAVGVGQFDDLPTSRTIGPEDDLAEALESLRPGGVTELRLEPGTYEVVDRNVVVKAGTPDQRITVIAADPAEPPLIRGSLVLQNPSYWTIDRLVFQGAQSTYEALRMNGGTGWNILRSEFMGQPGYTAQALLNVANYRDTAPRAFRVAYSCFHDGPTAPPSVHDHMVYVTSSVPPSPSYVSRNIFWGNPNGAAIKSNSSNVRINFNTIQDAAGAVTVQENGASSRGIQGVTTERNLVQTIRKLPGIDRTHVFWASMLEMSPRKRAKWLLRDNYAYSSNKPVYLERSHSGGGTVRIVGRSLHTTSGNPGFRGLGDCNGYRPTLPAAKAYGRWAGDGRSMLPVTDPAA